MNIKECIDFLKAIYTQDSVNLHGRREEIKTLIGWLEELQEYKRLDNKGLGDYINREDVLKLLNDNYRKLGLTDKALMELAKGVKDIAPALPAVDIKTNADRIRSMKDSELADYIFGVSCNEKECTVCKNFCGDCEQEDEYCKSKILEWLKNEVSI